MPMTMAVGGLSNHSLGYHLPPAYCRYPHFEARIGANVTPPGDNKSIQIPFISNVNSGGYFNDATHVWIPPAGLIRLALYATERSTNTYDQELMITKNGVDIYISDNDHGQAVGYRQGRSVAIEVETNGSDYWGAYFYRWNGTAYVEQYWTVFMGTMINWVPS